MSDGGSERGMSPPCSGSPQDSDAEPEELVDDDSDNNWEDVPGKATPPSRKQVAQKQIPWLGDSNDDGDLPDVAGVSTWLERNPGKHAIPDNANPRFFWVKYSQNRRDAALDAYVGLQNLQ
ncbi:hypothetical protein B0H14DRAFT_3488751 [Mycena olivaceomarginata]|nr:hypothetical protein B0H14DRAFT_3488751 [Mycena olivaceomarginata]